MGLLMYDGTNEAALSEALAVIKPGSTFEPQTGPDYVSFTQVLPDGQLIPGRWIIRQGDALDTVTGEVHNQDGPVDYKDIIIPVAPTVQELYVFDAGPAVPPVSGTDPADVP